MSMLDAHIPQLVASQSAFAAKAGLMRSTIGQAEQEAMSAQAFHAGESAAAFQAAHARFVAAAAQINTLLDVAPANLGDAAGTDMAGYAGTLQSLGADIASEQAALQAGWQGDTGMSYQAWQAQWNQAMEQLVLAYRAMAGTHENNTTSMLARDAAEGAKWGG